MRLTTLFLFLLLSVCGYSQNTTVKILDTQDSVTAYTPSGRQPVLSLAADTGVLYRWNGAIWIPDAATDSTRLVQDSILVYYQSGGEIGRDTITGTGGGGGSVAEPSAQVVFGTGAGVDSDPDFNFDGGRLYIGREQATSVDSAALEVRRTYNGVAASPIATAIFRNTGDTVGGSDYQNEVHLVLQTGTDTTHRRYINFRGHDNIDDGVMGLNAQNSLIWFNSNDATHWFTAETSANGGRFFMNSIGTGAIEINKGDVSEPNRSPNGVKIYDAVASRGAGIQMDHSNISVGHNVSRTAGYHLNVGGKFFDTGMFGGIAIEAPSDLSELSSWYGVRVFAPGTTGIFTAGIRSSVANTASAWNLYMDGTAPNYFAGNVGFGSVTAPTEDIDISGNLRMRNGAAAGYILMSDATGVGSWVDTTGLFGGISTNIYNADGSLTGDRTVTLSGTNKLTFSGVKGIHVNDGSTVTTSSFARQGLTLNIPFDGINTVYSIYSEGPAPSYHLGNFGVGALPSGQVDFVVDDNIELSSRAFVVADKVGTTDAAGMIQGLNLGRIASAFRNTITGYSSAFVHDSTGTTLYSSPSVAGSTIIPQVAKFLNNGKFIIGAATTTPHKALIDGNTQVNGDLYVVDQSVSQNAYLSMENSSQVWSVGVGSTDKFTWTDENAGETFFEATAGEVYSGMIEVNNFGTGFGGVGTVTSGVDVDINTTMRLRGTTVNNTLDSFAVLNGDGILYTMSKAALIDTLNVNSLWTDNGAFLSPANGEGLDIAINGASGNDFQIWKNTSAGSYLVLRESGAGSWDFRSFTGGIGLNWLNLGSSGEIRLSEYTSTTFENNSQKYVATIDTSDGRIYKMSLTQLADTILKNTPSFWYEDPAFQINYDDDVLVGNNLLVGGGIALGHSNPDFGKIDLAGGLKFRNGLLNVSSDSILVFDANGDVAFRTVASLPTATDGNGIYSGSGSLTTATTVTQSGNLLTFDGAVTITDTAKIHALEITEANKGIFATTKGVGSSFIIDGSIADTTAGGVLDYAAFDQAPLRLNFRYYDVLTGEYDLQAQITTTAMEDHDEFGRGVRMTFYTTLNNTQGMQPMFDFEGSDFVMRKYGDGNKIRTYDYLLGVDADGMVSEVPTSGLGVSQPVNQIAYGTGTGLTSSIKFTYKASQFSARVDSNNIITTADLNHRIRIIQRDSINGDFSGIWSVTNDNIYVGMLSGDPTSSYSLVAGNVYKKTGGDDYMEFVFNNGGSNGKFPVFSSTTTNHVEWSAYAMPKVDPTTDGNVVLNYDATADTLGFKMDADDLAPASLNGTREDNYNPTGFTAPKNTIVLLSASSPTDITGLAAKEVGERAILINLSASNLTLKFQDTNSSAANRFQKLGSPSGDYILQAGHSAELIYSDAVAAGWYMLGDN